jgi:hypothetical protein
MINKKGFLSLEKNVLELVLTIIGLLLILSAVVYGFNKITSNQILRNAQTSLDILESRANSLQEGEMVVARLPGLCKGEKECNWFIAGWNKEKKENPEKCLFDNCICVCQGTPDTPDSRKIACQFSNSCRFLEGISGVVINKDVFIREEVRGVEAKEGRETSNKKVPVEFPAIAFSSNLIEVEISKNNGVVTFTKK